VIHRNYLVSYRLRPDKVEILDIWHSARQRSL
jgi:plasmid stabilization system protein ParE